MSEVAAQEACRVVRLRPSVSAPCVADPSIEDRVLAMAVLRRTGDEAQLLRLCSRHRQPQLAHTLDLDRQIIDQSRPTRGERTVTALVPQQGGQLFAGAHGHEPKLPLVQPAAHRGEPR